MARDVMIMHADSHAMLAVITQECLLTLFVGRALYQCYRGTASGYFYGSLGKKKEAKTA